MQKNAPNHSDNPSNLQKRNPYSDLYTSDIWYPQETLLHFQTQCQVILHEECLFNGVGVSLMHRMRPTHGSDSAEPVAVQSLDHTQKYLYTIHNWWYIYIFIIYIYIRIMGKAFFNPGKLFFNLKAFARESYIHAFFVCKYISCVYEYEVIYHILYAFVCFYPSCMIVHKFSS